MTDPETNEKTVLQPGSWLGVLGGGQLGSMFTHAAQQMGYQVAIFDTDRSCPAAQAANRHFCPTQSRESQLEHVIELAKLCDAVTLEFENIPPELVEAAAIHTHTRPGADFLRICQDRIREKSALVSAGIPTTPFLHVTNEQDVVRAGVELGWPLVLKTATSGYDGKGQTVVKSAEEVPSRFGSLASNHVIAEKMIDFRAEVSMLAARNPSGQIVTYPLLENRHANHILDVTVCPASVELQSVEPQATRICREIAEQFQCVGIFCVEFFVGLEDQLMVNEIAPRPHNSGHLTIEAFTCSQFEQQVRAICNLPLQPAQQLCDAAMVNLLGDVWSSGQPNWLHVLREPAAHLHLYGKSEPREGRKMGHVTVLGPDAAAKACHLREALRQ